MLPQWIIIGVLFAVNLTGCFGNAFVSRSKDGTISVVGPAFVNREVTLKVIQFYPWECDLQWRYILDKGTTVQTLNGTNVNRYSEDGSFFLKWTASAEYNRAQFYAVCSTNVRIRTGMTSLNMKDIVGKCGALGLLSPVVLGADVELGYFPSGHVIRNKTDTKRKWKKDNHEIQLPEGFYSEKRVTEYLYILTIFNFNKTDEGMYVLNCHSGGNTDSVQLNISERPSFPVLGPKYPDFNTTECIYVYGGSKFYCKTENGTEPVQVALLVGQDLFTPAEIETKRGMYRLYDVNQHMAGLSRRNVTCQVSNAALETPYEVQGTLCSVEKGSRPVLRVPEQLHGINSTSICEVRDAFPAPEIKIRVGKVVQADVQQIDLFNGSSHTFTCTATMTKTSKTWNGKRMCCTMKTKYEFGLGNVSVCKNISMKCDPTLNLNKTSPVDLLPNKTVVVKCTVDDCNANALWTLRWEDEHNSIIKTCKKTEECLLTLNYMVEGEKTYTCSARKSQDLLNISLTVSSSMSDGGPTLSFNTTSPVYLCPKNTVTVKCRVDGSNAKGQWTLMWEDENNTIIKTCNKTDTCLLTLTYMGDGKKTFVCNARKSKELLRYFLTVSSSITKALFMQSTTVKENNHNILNLTCNSGETCMPCAIAWSSNSVFLYPISTSQWTNKSDSGYISVSNALFFITKDVKGKRIQCSANCRNDSSDIIHETYTIGFDAFQEAATNPASFVVQPLHMSVLYALSGTILLLLVTTLTVLLFRRCKSQGGGAQDVLFLIARCASSILPVRMKCFCAEENLHIATKATMCTTLFSLLLRQRCFTS
ncbi:uncharacterized protein LOC128235241 isoform X2 [Mya arenaria]|uniref:uncharacterized protein LOC128235241 isoform X2 n=1 Tax=Mya arenaria TaxID=6604 RepID=UPI0022E1C294|nr:uncharacterized protein LOC128235241 isoform X2 [Mya arenaria]